MGEPQQIIAVAGATPFAFVLAGLLAADHGRKVYIVADRPTQHAVPPPSSFTVAPMTRPDTLQLALANGPGLMRRIGKIAPDSIERTDLVVSTTTAYHANALSHFRHLAAGFGLVVERIVDAAADERENVRIRDVIRLSAAPFFAGVFDWANRIGIEWVETGSLAIRRNGMPYLGETAVDKLVLADDETILSHLDPTTLAEIGTTAGHLAFIAERGHGVGNPQFALSQGVLLDPRRDGSLTIHADDREGMAEARIAAVLPPGTLVRRAAMRPYSQLVTHDGAPVVGIPKRGRAYIAAGLGALDIALAPTIARHIAGEVRGYEAEWCGLRTPVREMTASMVADVASGVAA